MFYLIVISKFSEPSYFPSTHESNLDNRTEDALPSIGTQTINLQKIIFVDIFVNV